MKTPHKHAVIIKAWADGAEIQERYKAYKTWIPFDGTWTENNDWECRIKPDPKPDVVMLLRAEFHHGLPHIYMADMATNLKLTFDGETGKLKAAEVIA